MDFAIAGRHIHLFPLGVLLLAFLVVMAVVTAWVAVKVFRRRTWHPEHRK
jgi:hypothetical protein